MPASGNAENLQRYLIEMGSSLMLAEISGSAAVITLSQALLLAAGLPLLHGFQGWSAAEWALMAAGALLLAAAVPGIVLLGLLFERFDPSRELDVVI